MKKLSIFTVILLFCYVTVYSQSCLPEGISFTTQAQIDSFQILHPNCTKIEGTVYIGCTFNDITNLAGLDVLTSIGGSLIFGSQGAANSSGTHLINLEGLEGLDSIHENLGIVSNGQLEDISALDGLKYLGGNLSIRWNQALVTCQSAGLCNYLLNPNGAVAIYSNGPGCNSVVELGANCNDSIPCLPYGDYYLILQTDIDNFQDVFPGCTELRGDLTIAPHGPLGKGGAYSVLGSTITNLAGLNVVTSIGGGLFVYRNDSLESLSGIDNIDENSITALHINNNPLLSICEVLSVCSYLDLPGAEIDIDDNAPGCNSKWQVRNACESVLVYEQYLTENIRIYPNPANHELNISADGYVIEEVAIYAFTGQQIMKARLVNGKVDISYLQPGLYIVEVIVENIRLRRKLLVE